MMMGTGGQGTGVVLPSCPSKLTGDLLDSDDCEEEEEEDEDAADLGDFSESDE